MFVSINWIKDFTKLPDIAAIDLATRFTMATCEVEDVVEHGRHLKTITIAEIISINKHPEADSLNLVTVKIDDNKSKEVVCGAPNVAVGMKVPFAPLGTVFSSQFTLTPKIIRGIVSEGMLCSEAELGLGGDESGLFVQPSDAPLGMSMAEYYNRTVDTVFDIDNKSITHRPDLWGHIGMAREFAIVFDSEFNNRFDREWEKTLLMKMGQGESPIIPLVDDESCCLAYYGLSVDNIKVEQSPQWMRQRLESCGVRSINNIVDVSNYVLLELGCPMHIFDRDCIEDNKIIIKRIGEPTQLETLDEIKRDLIETDTVVADAKGPLVIAGIMGGQLSGVTENTSRIFIEAANWVDVEVRKTSSRIGLRTESSQRYEKSLDSQMLMTVMLRSLELILELCPDAKVAGKIEFGGKETGEYKPLVINVDSGRISRVIGKDIALKTSVSILEKLNFKVTKKENIISVEVPSFRATKDVECEADIIEEIGRIIGYDNIEPVSPLNRILPVRLNASKRLHRKIQDSLVFQASALEIYTNPMIGESLLKKADWETMNEELVLVNALSNDHDRMRPSLIPSALEAVALNAKTYSKFTFFELGRSYLPDNKDFSKDLNQVAIVAYDKKESVFMSLVNTVEKLLLTCNIPAFVEPVNEKFQSTIVSRKWNGLHPHEMLDVKIMGKNDGIITTIHPIICKNFKIKGNLSIAVIGLNLFEEREMKDKTVYRTIPKYPSSSFDCTVVAGMKESVSVVLDVFKKKKIQYMGSIKIVDIFNMDENRKSITLRAVLSDPEKTLSSEALDNAKNGIVKRLSDAGFSLKM